MNTAPVPSPSEGWISISRPRRDPRVRLLCLPYAGGGPSAYASWSRHLPEWIEVWAVAPPGREARSEEESVRTMDEYLAPIVAALLAAPPVPTAIFGHSMGAVTGYEVARRCTEEGLVPVHLFLSGRNFPSDLPAEEPLFRLQDEEFVRAIRRIFGGLPEELDGYPELLSQARDLLRADLEVLERFQPLFTPVLYTPITLLWSANDASLSVEQMLRWRRVTRRESSHHIFRGSHFYLLEQVAEVTVLVTDRLKVLRAG